MMQCAFIFSVFMNFTPASSDPLANDCAPIKELTIEHATSIDAFPEPRYWQWQGLKICYQCQGNEGPAVILVHGFGASWGIGAR